MPATDRQKRISVALITCNGERFLAELLDSLLRQTSPPWEVVVCDDASTDRTPEILCDFSAKLPMKIFRNDQRLGVNRNFEKAIGQ